MFEKVGSESYSGVVTVGTAVRVILLQARRLEQLPPASADESAEFSWLERCPVVG